MLRVEGVEGSSDRRVAGLEALPCAVLSLVIGFPGLELLNRNPLDIQDAGDDRVGVEPGGKAAYVEEWDCHLQAFRSVSVVLLGWERVTWGWPPPPCRSIAYLLKERQDA